MLYFEAQFCCIRKRLDEIVVVVAVVVVVVAAGFLEDFISRFVADGGEGGDDPGEF